jgi:hypothetical protein
LTLTVSAAGAGSAPTITTASLPDARVGIFYAVRLQATGSPDTFTWSITSGNKPAWLSLSSVGDLTGTPQLGDVTAGITLGFSCSNGVAPNATANLNLAVVTIAPAITPLVLQPGVVGVPYERQLLATGAPPTFTWSITSGNKPSWLSLSAGGMLSGTPAAGDLTSGINLSFSCSNGIAPDAAATFGLTVQVQPAGITPEVTVWNRVRNAINNPNPLGTQPTQPGQILQAWTGNGIDWSGRRGTLATGVLPSQAGVAAGSIKLAPSVTGIVAGAHNLYLTSNSSTLPAQAYYNITAWDNSTKIATVSLLFKDFDFVAGSNFEVCVFTQEAVYQTTVQQQWQRRATSGDAWANIDTANNGSTLGAGAYTTTSDDAGKQISVLQTVVDKTNGTRTGRSQVFSIGTNALDSKLVYANNMTYLGAFRAPTNTFAAYALNGLSFDSAGNSGAGSLFASQLYDNRLVGEFSIPTPVITSSFSALPISGGGSFLQAPVEATEGAYLLSGTGGAGASDYRLNGTLVYNNKLILGSCNTYSGFPAMSHWRRPRNLSTTGQVEGGVWLDDINQQYRNPRFTGGYMCHIPSTTVDGVNYQTALGGPVLTGVGHMSRNQTQSQGPCAWAFNPDDIAGKAAVYGNCPDQSGLSSNQIKLAAGTTGIDTNKYIIINGGPPFSTVGDGNPTRIIGWDNATKIATVEIPYGTRPNASSTYAIFDRVVGTPLVWYPFAYAADGQEYALERTNGFEAVSQFNFQPVVSNDGAKGLAIPTGTRSLLAVSYSGSGYRRYNNFWPQWDPGQNQSTKAAPTYEPIRAKIYAYDLAQMAQVKSGAITSAELVPYAIWYLTPWPASPSSFVNGVAYDPSTKRLFVSVENIGSFGEAAIFVWQITNAV